MNERRKHSWSIKKWYFQQLNSGEKTLDVRLGYATVLRVRVGDIVTFDSYLNQPFEVVRITKYDDLVEVFENEDYKKVLPRVSNKYKALDELQEIYSEEREKDLGVYVFEFKKYYNKKILSVSSSLNKDHTLFTDLIANAYKVTDYLCKDYPNHFNWYWSKTVPGIFNGTREILICTVNKKIAGVAFLKNENDEKKICTFLILELYRKMDIDSKLIEKSFEFLGTTRPLISIPEYKLNMFKNIIKKYDWEQTQILDKGYYNDSSREIVFNGKIS